MIINLSPVIFYFVRIATKTGWLNAIQPDFARRIRYWSPMKSIFAIWGDAPWAFGRPSNCPRRFRFILNATLVALLNFPIQCGAASATEETDAQITVLKSGSLPQKIALLASIDVCASLPQEYRAPIKAIALDEKQPDAVRILASVALCDVRDASASILPLLARGVSELKIAPSTRSATLTVIKHISAKASDAKETDLLPALEAAREQVAASRAAGAVESAEIDASVEKLDQTIRYLRSVSEVEFEKLALKFASEHVGALALGAAYLVLLIALTVLSLASPRRVVVIDETLQKLSFKLPDWLGGSSISPRYLLFTNFLVRGARVLDQWIAANLPAARRSFERTAPSLAPAPVASMSLKIDGKPADATQASIRGLLESGASRIMILGAPELRSGLLGRIARWCLAGELLPNVMLPLWFDRDLLASCKDGKELFEKARNLFKLSVETEVSADFFSLLISRRRVALIVPDLSKTDTRAMAELMTMAFPSGACLFLGADEAPKGLLMSFAQIEVEAVGAKR
jgi:hypothetical protein